MQAMTSTGAAIAVVTTVAASSLCQSPRRLATTQAASGRKRAVSSGMACSERPTSSSAGLMCMWKATVDALCPSA